MDQYHDPKYRSTIAFEKGEYSRSEREYSRDTPGWRILKKSASRSVAMMQCDKESAQRRMRVVGVGQVIEL